MQEKFVGEIDSRSRDKQRKYLEGQKRLRFEECGPCGRGYAKQATYNEMMKLFYSRNSLFYSRNSTTVEHKNLHKMMNK